MMTLVEVTRGRRHVSRDSCGTPTFCEDVPLFALWFVLGLSHRIAGHATPLCPGLPVVAVNISVGLPICEGMPHQWQLHPQRGGQRCGGCLPSLPQGMCTSSTDLSSPAPITVIPRSSWMRQDEVGRGLYGHAPFRRRQCHAACGRCYWTVPTVPALWLVAESAHVLRRIRSLDGSRH